jgi:hypothetical protein
MGTTEWIAGQDRQILAAEEAARVAQAELAELEAQRAGVQNSGAEYLQKSRRIDRKERGSYVIAG